MLGAASATTKLKQSNLKAISWESNHFPSLLKEYQANRYLVKSYTKHTLTAAVRGHRGPQCYITGYQISVCKCSFSCGCDSK